MNRLSAACPWLFVVFALATALFLAVNLPPYMGVDEPAHAARAALTTLGRAAGERVPLGGQVFAGGPAEQALYLAQQPFTPMIGDAGRRANLSDFQAAATARWDGRTAPSWYAGSATYPPFLYLPASAGFALGKLFDRPVVQSLQWARMGDAFACAALGWAALMLAGRARLFFFAVLTLPMAMALYGSVTTDGMGVVLSALGCALVAGPMGEGRPMRRRELVAAALCFALVGMTKPPYALLGLILLAAPTAEGRRWRLAAALAPLAAALVWNGAMALAVQTALTAQTDPAGQTRHLLSHPAAVISIAVETLRAHGPFYLRSFVGVLGWLDTWLPGPYYALAWLVLAAALALSLSHGGRANWGRMPWTAAGTALAAAGATFAALYITWDLVGATRVDGVQGRYFLPLAFLAPLACLGRKPLVQRLPLAERWTPWLAGAVLAFPLLSAILIQHAVIVRYYLD